MYAVLRLSVMIVPPLGAVQALASYRSIQKAVEPVPTFTTWSAEDVLRQAVTDSLVKPTATPASSCA